MAPEILPGDLAVSTAGRDKGKAFLIVRADSGFAFVVDGRTHKIKKPKKKNLKHLKVFCVGELKSLAERIVNGECVGNERVYKAIASKKDRRISLCRKTTL